ncbi:MAG TPA: hypothetical protein VGO00_21410 [Kofleriaceae bacterium]|jgi:hypothetical protein|nr:hypothetical protein [Kofleriaceae bacterium]
MFVRDSSSSRISTTARSDRSARTSCVALVVALCACRRDPVASCADELQGIWDGSDRSWSILDDGTRIEIDPLFADAPDNAAPRVMDLERSGDGLSGTEHQLYSRRADHCDAKLPVRITSCRDNRIEIVLTEPAPPIAWSPCEWPRSAPSRVERWQRH